MKKQITHILILVLISISGVLNAQIPLDVQASIAPPFPKQFSFWTSNASSFFVTVINNSNTEFDYYVKVSLESTDGQTYARFREEFRPDVPFTAQANSVRTFDSAVLGNAYSNLSLEELDISENIPLDVNGELPAGEYVICVELIEFSDDPSAPIVYLSPNNCTDPFEVNQGNIELIYPQDQSVQPKDFPLTLSWINNNAYGYDPEQEYIVKLYELDSLTAANESIYDLVETGSIPAIFASEPTNDLNIYYDYTFGEISMTEGYMYAAQVEVSETAGTYFENGGKSNINTFWYGFDPTFTPPVIEDPVSQAQIDCFENCNYSLDGNTSLLTDPAPSTIAVGHFNMDEIEIVSASNGYYTGSGRIKIPWLNDIYVKTTFNAIKVNSTYRMIEGLVTADQAPDIPTYAAEFNSFLASGRLIAGLLGSDATLDLPIGINQNIAGYNFLVGITEITFSPTSADANTACNFHIPAFGDQYIGLESSETCMHPGGFGNEFYLHMPQDLSIASNGEITVNIKGSSESDIDKIEEEACYLQMDCNGMKSISIKADVLFPANMLVKENVEDGSIINDETIGAENRVTANFNFTLDRETGIDQNVYALYGEEGIPYESGLHFIASATVEDPFQIKGVQGWGFEVVDIWVDASEVKNPVDIDFPEGFLYDNGIDGTIDDTWTGFYMKELTMRTPQEFLRDQTREELSVYNIIIDPTITLSISVNNVIGINKGEVDKWSFSIDKIFMDIVQGHFEAGGLEGQIGLPIAEEGTFIDYSAIISDSDLTNSELDPLEYIFSMSPAEGFDVPMLLAQINLDPASYILGGIEPGNSDATYFELYAAGGLAFNSDLFNGSDGNKPLPLTSPLTSFDLKFHSKEGFTRHNFGFLGDFNFETSEGSSDGPSATTGSGTGSYGSAYNKESFSGFPLTMIDMSIENVDVTNGEFNLRIQPEITLTNGKSGIAASAILNIPSVLSYTESQGNRLKFQRLYPSGITIDHEMGGCTIGGAMEFYDNQGSSGVGSKGVKGALDVMLPMGIGVMMEAEFGTMVADPLAVYNTEDNYPYFYVDGMAYFGENGGIPVAGALAIYGIGGGLSYNMTRSGYEGDEAAVAAQLAAVNSGNPVNPDNMKASDIRTTGETPVPSFGVYGLKVAATIGTALNAGLLNADISVEGEFELDRGLTLLAVRGNGFMLTPLSDRADPSVEVEMNIVYETPLAGQHIFDGDLTVWANFNDLFYGTGTNNKVGTAAIHADNGTRDTKGSWFFHLGKPSDRMGFELKLAGLAKAEANTYFMLGHGLPTSLPVPEKVKDLFGATNSGKGGGLDSQTINGAEDREEDDITDAADGTGFALGAEAAVSINVDALGVYAYLGVFLGFDINVTHSLTRTCYIPGEGNMSPGTNGWYGSGQIYAGLEGGLGFRVKAFGKNHDLELFALKAAMMLAGGGPNPFWAEGRAGISISVLGGLIKCSKSISVRAGDQCTPSYDDPFGGVPLIAEHWPEHQDKKQSTWTKPKISFTFPMNEVLTMPMLNDDGEPYNDYLEPKFEDLVFKQRDSDTLVTFTQVWSDENRQLELKPTGNLSPQTWYEVSMRLYAIDYPGLVPSLSKSGGSRVRVDGATWYQDTTFTFKCGKLSSLEDIITTSIPIRNQRYFVQNDVWGLAGGLASISFDIGAQQEDYFLTEDDDKTYQYYMRFSPMDGGDPVEKGLNLFGSNPVDKMTYYLPNLQNDQTYAAQLIQKHSYKNEVENVLGRLGPLSFSLADSDASAATNEITSETAVHFQNQKINPAEDLGWNEKSMITYFFKTSKFNTYEEKFAGVNSSFQLYPDEELHLDMTELLDEFDVHGETWDGSKTMDPLVQIFDPISYSSLNHDGLINMKYTSWYEEVVRDMFVDLAESYETRRTWPDYDLPDSWPADELNFDYLSDIELRMTKKVLNFENKLSDTDIDNSWAHIYGGSEYLTGYSNYASTNFSNADDLKIKITLWDKFNEDKSIILDWAAGVYADRVMFNNAVVFDNSDWIDENYNKFNNRVDDIQGQYIAPLGRSGEFRLQFYRDKFWINGDRGDVFKTIDY